jgi:hypothetical protein
MSRIGRGAGARAGIRRLPPAAAGAAAPAPAPAQVLDEAQHAVGHEEDHHHHQDAVDEHVGVGQVLLEEEPGGEVWETPREKSRSAKRLERSASASGTSTSAPDHRAEDGADAADDADEDDLHRDVHRRAASRGR